MNQFESLKTLLLHLQKHGAVRFFLKVLQENDNSKQQIYVADRPSSIAFLDSAWAFDAEAAIPKSSIDFSWITPEAISPAPHAKLIYYPSYPEVRLSGLLLDSPLAPKDYMQPIPKDQRTGSDRRVLILGVNKEGAILGHLALPGTSCSDEAIELRGESALSEVFLDANGAIVRSQSTTGDISTVDAEFGVEVELSDDESEDDYSDDDLFSISSWGADLSFRELIARYDENELVKPELQRHYVWDKAEASRFIDSVLLGLPVPSIFLAKTKEEKLLIIDGYQRLMTVRDYVSGVFSKDKSVFKLSRTEKIHERWRGKAFSELTEDERRKIRNTTIHAIIFMQQNHKEDDTSLFQVFERINSSGRTLLPQEIRNCVYQGPLNSLLIELNEVAEWRELWGGVGRDDRMRDIEFILRFFALSDELIMTSSSAPPRISLKKYLNQFMGENNKSSVCGPFRDRFVRTVKFIHKNIGKNAFNNVSQSPGARRVSTFSPTVFDSVMIATDMALRSGSPVSTTDLDQKRTSKLQDAEYQGLLYQETMRIPNIRLRVLQMKSALY